MKSSTFSPVHLPLGQRIPDSPHAVSVSLPTYADVVSYEEKEPATMAKVSSGYPRFVKHPYIVELAENYIRERELTEDKQVLFFSSCRALHDAIKLHPQHWEIETDGYHGVCLVVVDKGSEEEKEFANYLQHTGTGLSSREAEDLLIKLGLRSKSLDESCELEFDQATLDSQLQDWFSPFYRSAIFPCKSGMNAFYSAFRTINQIQEFRGRKGWISIGWLYLDTLKILEKYVDDDSESIWFKDASKTDEIVDYIETYGQGIAGLVLEAPTNPLVHTPDIKRISEACKQAGILTIMDPSLVSPQNVDLSPWCDIICCSLTKYSVSEGDVMIGALSVNLETEWGRNLEILLKEIITPAYQRDLVRLSESLVHAKDIIKKINANTITLATYFEHHPKVEKTYWAYSPEYKDSYQRIHRRAERPGGVITLKLKDHIKTFYDPLPLPKGPSFGTAFTLVCAYIHIAHYDLLQTEDGRAIMSEAGLDDKMIRLSIGTEDPEELIKVFDEVLGVD